MRTLTAAAVVLGLLGAPLIVPSSTAEAAERAGGPKEVAGTNLKHETKALKLLVAAIKADRAAGRVDTTVGSEQAWRLGQQLWDTILDEAEAGRLPNAYARTREARHLLADSIVPALQGAPSATARRAIADYVDVIRYRRDALATHVAEHGVDPGLAADLDHAEALWTEAVTAHDRGEHQVALRSLLQSLDAYDTVILGVWPI